MYQSQAASGAAGPSRRDDFGRRDDDSRVNGPREPYQNRQWSRPSPGPSSFRHFPAYGSRTRTPSPPPRRDFDRDRHVDWDRDWDRGFIDRSGGPEGPPRRGGPPLRDRPPERDWERAPRGGWNDRRDDRYRDEGRAPPPNRPLNSGPPPRMDRLPPRSPPSIPRGPRGPNQMSPQSLAGSRILSGSRIGHGIPPWEERERDREFKSVRPFDRAGSVPGPGPSTTMYARKARYSPPSPSDAPRAPRSMRGSSSPVEAKQERHSPRIDRPMPLPSNDNDRIRHQGGDREVEEGEVLSPVKRLDSWNPNERNRPPIGWFASPRDRERDIRNRPIRERLRESEGPRRGMSPNLSRRLSDQGWSGRGRRRSLSSSAERGGSGVNGFSENGYVPTQAKSLSPEKRQLEVIRDRSKERPQTGKEQFVSQDRLHQEKDLNGDTTKPPSSSAGIEPSLISSSGLGIHMSPLVEDSVVSSLVTSNPILRPDTPAFPPPVETRELAAPSAISAWISPSSRTAAQRPATPPLPHEEVSVLSDNAALGKLETSHPAKVRFEGQLRNGDVSRSETSLMDIEMGIDVKRSPETMDESVAVVQNPSKSSEIDNGMETFSASISPRREAAETSDDLPSTYMLPAPPESTTKVATIAERRSIVLPPSDAQLPTPFGVSFADHDPTPTADSAFDPTDGDLESKTVPDNGDDTESEKSEGFLEAARMTNMMATIKRLGKATCNVEAVYAWNAAVAPVPSTRGGLLDDYERERYLHSLSNDLASSQGPIAHLSAELIKEKRADLEAKITRLTREYRQLNVEWKEHHDHLRQTMEKRGQPPEDFYALPSAFPALTPGPVLTTPLVEDSSSSRRRRTQGDSVLTDAALEEVLAGLADTHSRDPDARARKTAATIPDMMLGPERDYRYVDDNDLVSDPLAFYDFAGNAEPVWTKEERDTFTRRYLMYPKQFGRIADCAGLETKTAKDCVLYYYRTKKVRDYKGLLAARRGTAGKRKALPIKKGGKSASLLSNLAGKEAGEGQNKGGVSTPNGDGSSTPAPAGRRGRPPRSESALPATPGDDGSASTSRAPSEAPSAQKPKMRMTGKVKRPRISSLTQVVQSDGTLSIVDTAKDLAKDSELLPAVKRAAKRRKIPVDPSNPNATDTPVKDKTPRRPGATNSYWSAPEKKRFIELVIAHGCDFAAIALSLEGKSLVQVRNYFVNNRESLKLDDLATLPPPDQIPGIATKADGRSTDIANQPGPYSRTIYDSYMTVGSHIPSQPRLAVFPGTATPTSNNRPSLPDSPISQPPVRGRMGISALLNDDTPDMSKYHDMNDAASDGTVDERDLEPSRRPSPKLVVSSATYSRDPQTRPPHGPYDRPDLDRFATPKSYSYDSSPAPSPWQRDVNGFHSDSNERGSAPPAPIRSWDNPARTSYPPQSLQPPSSHTQHPQLGVFPSSRAPDNYRRVSSSERPSYPPSTDHHPSSSQARTESLSFDRPTDWRAYMSTGGPHRVDSPTNRTSPTRPGYSLPPVSHGSSSTSSSVSRPFDARGGPHGGHQNQTQYQSLSRN